MMVDSKKNTCTVAWTASWTKCFSMEHPFYLKELLTNCGYLDLVIWQITFENHWSESVISRKITDNICYQWQYLNFYEKNYKFGKLYLSSCTQQLSKLKEFSDVIISNINRWIMTCFNISNISVSQSTNILQMSNG